MQIFVALTYPFKLICMIAIYFYKIFISPFIPKSCRYIPSCPNYALEVLQNYGLIKGVFLILKRLLRCNHTAKGGYDPIPYNIKGDIKWLI